MTDRTILKINDFPQIEEVNSNPAFLLRLIDNQYYYVGGNIDDVFNFIRKNTSVKPVVHLKEVSSKLVHHILDSYPHRAVDIDTTAVYWWRPKLLSNGFLGIELLPDSEKVELPYDSSQDVLDFDSIFTNHKMIDSPYHKMIFENTGLEGSFSFKKDGDFITIEMNTEELSLNEISGDIDSQSLDYEFFNYTLDKHVLDLDQRHTIILEEDNNSYHLEMEDGLLVFRLQRETRI